MGLVGDAAELGPSPLAELPQGIAEGGDVHLGGIGRGKTDGEVERDKRRAVRSGLVPQARDQRFDITDGLGRPDAVRPVRLKRRAGQ
jgi:hypothetical protein